MGERTCSDESCDRAPVARGLCNTHYVRVWRQDALPDWQPTRTCPDCGVTFNVPLRASMALWCQPCRWKRTRAQERDSRRAKRAAEPARMVELPPCVDCGCVRPPVEARGAKASRCEECRVLHLAAQRAAWRKSNPAAQRRYAQKRRAFERAAPYESVDEAVVFDRDGWRCQLCLLPVDPNCVYPDPMSPSLDHRIPLIKHGHHTYANVQLAHLRCNKRKSSKILE